MGSNSPRPQRESSGGGPRGPKRQHRKVCSFCVEKISHIDYKEVSRLRRFISDRGKILPRRVTGTCARHQRPLVQGAGAGHAPGEDLAAVAEVAAQARDLLVVDVVDVLQAEGAHLAVSAAVVVRHASL